MKALPILSTLLLAPALTLSSLADVRPLTSEDYLPTNGTLLKGQQVRVVHASDMREALSKLNSIEETIANSRKRRKEAAETAFRNFRNSFENNERPAYSPIIWPRRRDYDAFIGVWKRAKIEPVATVAVGLQKTDDGTWRLLSLTFDRQSNKTSPLSLGTLRYDDRHNEWISPNGILQASEFSVSDKNIYGAQTGTSWELEKKDSISTTRETLRISRTTDNQYIYISYSLTVKSDFTDSQWRPNSYILRFPVLSTSADLGKPGVR